MVFVNGSQGDSNGLPDLRTIDLALSLQDGDMSGLKGRGKDSTQID